MKSTSTNILLIHSDQHRYDCIAAHGMREGLETPNLDRLAREGTSFSQAFSTIPICTPARASLLTGAWPTTHGCFSIPSSEINRAARTHLPTITDLLSHQNYRVAWTGKFHQELEQSPGPWCGVEAFVPCDQYAAYREAKGIPPAERIHGIFGDVDRACPSEHAHLAWQADQVIRQITERKDDAFFVRWDPPEPHLPCEPTQAFFDRYCSMDIPPWSSFPDDLSGKPGALLRQSKIWGTTGWDWEDWQPIVRLYYAIITELDHHIGRVLDAVEALGLTENTLVIYSTDHGDFCGGHGMMDKHFNMYEDVQRIPLLLRQPHIVPAGETCDAFASGSIDIARTVLEAAGITPPKTFVGENLLACASDPTHRPRTYAYAQYFGTESGAYSCRMIRDHRYKFVYHPVGDCDELYDLEIDPGERHNRIHDPDYGEELTRLKAALHDEMITCGDRLGNTWTAVELKGRPDRAEESRMPLSS